MLPLKGIHHVTAITSSAEKIYEFFTYVLGLRLVKKTINQDDIQTYHLFFADEFGSPGTDMTFFDFRGIAKATKGANEISRTGFRVTNDLIIIKLNMNLSRHYSVEKYCFSVTLTAKIMHYFQMSKIRALNQVHHGKKDQYQMSLGLLA